jgi:hypothetical protein
MTRAERRELIRDMSLRWDLLNIVLQQMGHVNNGGLFGKGRRLQRIKQVAANRILENFNFE